MLDKQQYKFIDEYLLTYNYEAAAIKAGYPREQAKSIALDLLANETIQAELKAREKDLNNAASFLVMTKERLLTLMMGQYNQASSKGDTRAAIEVLERIARWSGVKPEEIIIDPVKLVINGIDNTKI